ncbi:MAG TPA: hypothetical protein VJY63_03780 [Marinospirillum sp.]|uniref:hypothetical protein n=1 Tax=Marinospirillum sp. TaxID=2183934 RepID=UPI002B47556B|nr:hypothetical protein [Marinospirillum sp.]HKM15032.1 hypothetical protein [Marinospirillum sp.]
MDISNVSPENMVKATLQQRDSQAHLDAKIGLVKQAREAEGDAVMALLASVPPLQPEGSLGNKVNLMV